MNPENRRTFVKKSLLTTITLSSATFFSGLIRAKGDEGGGSTTTGVTTTYAFTTGGYDGSGGGGYETTVVVTDVSTTVGSTDYYTTDLNIWSVEYTWSAGGPVEVDGTSSSDDAVEILKKALAKRHGSSPGTPGQVHRAPGGTELDPHEFTAVTAPIESGTNPTYSFNETMKKWTLTFDAGYTYSEIYRE